MGKFIIGAFVCALLLGCARETQYGKCVGYGQEKDPTLEYEYSTRNIVVGAIFAQTIFVPVLVFFKQLECPTNIKNK